MWAALMSLLLHLPNASGPGEFGTPQTAFPIVDISKSIVLYDPVECSAPQLWMAYDATPGAQLYVQLGVPVIDRLEDYRPHIAVVAPGFPPSELPFPIPEGLGAIEFPTQGVTPTPFEEPFSDTQSWVLAEATLTLPEAGRGYIVAWTPDRRTGKQWVAVGTVEDFTGGLPIPLEEVQKFHEVGPYAPTEPVMETVCEDAGGGDDGGGSEGGEDDGGTGDDGDLGESGDGSDPSASSTGGGCSVAAPSHDDAPLGLAWALLPLLGWRRRR